MKKKTNVQIHGGWSLSASKSMHLPCLCGMSCRAETVSNHVALYSSRYSQSFNSYDSSRKGKIN